MKIAMWSGPRNLSTALMYSFAQRSDMSVVDEPFYAAYLAANGMDHPMREEVLNAQPTDPGQVIDALMSGSEAQHQYQKQMTQHLLADFPRDWFKDVRHVFLIRHPARVLASWMLKHESLTLDDIGFSQQLDIFNAVSNLTGSPLVIDATDIRANPEQMLKKLCQRLDLPWDSAMLSWPVGPKPFDGVWASHWYDAVHQSVGFAGVEKPLPKLNEKERAICDDALPIYETLARYKL